MEGDNKQLTTVRDMERIIEKTGDGSATLFVPELNEHYHSVKGAQTESRHIFIDMGLKASASPAPRVLEVGFGTGLNAWLTLKEAERSGRSVHYTGLELHPLDLQLVERLGYVSEDERLTVDDRPCPAGELFRRLHTSAWEEDTAITPHFTLRKVQADVNEWTGCCPPMPVSIIYFDAFAPEKQPEMWSQELFDRLYALLEKDGILTTYCAKGSVRRMLQAAGFVVERLPGPPGGKREILRGRKAVES